MSSVHGAGAAAAAVALAAVLLTAGCSAGQAQGASPSALDSPTTAAVSWFGAVSWDVYLRRQPDGRWLIDAHGQG